MTINRRPPLRFCRRGGSRRAAGSLLAGPPPFPGALRLPKFRRGAASGVRPCPVGPRGPRPPRPPSWRAGRPSSWLLPLVLRRSRSRPRPLLPRRGDASAWAGRVPGCETGGSRVAGVVRRASGGVGGGTPARGDGASAAAARPPGACGEREREDHPRGSFVGAVPRPRGPVSRPSPPPLPLPGADRSGAGPRDAAASVRRRDLPPGCGSRPGKERVRGLRPGLPAAPSPRPVPSFSLSLSSPSVARARPPLLSSSGPRPQIRRGDPLNLSILVSGGKETNQDSLSNGE